MAYTRKIGWNGDVEGLNDPVSTIWGGYRPCWWPGESFDDVASGCADIPAEDMYWEDLNIKWITSPVLPFAFGTNELLSVTDTLNWIQIGRSDVGSLVTEYVTATGVWADKDPGTAPKAPASPSYTWGDYRLALDLFNELRGANRSGKAGRRGKLDTWSEENPEDKKKLIRLICRVKGEKVYDEKKEVGDIKIKLKDVDMVINEILGKIKVETKDVL